MYRDTEWSVDRKTWDETGNSWKQVCIDLREVGFFSLSVYDAEMGSRLHTLVLNHLAGGLELL